MTCEISQTRLHAYFDGELDAMGAAEFERHLESCPDCETRLAAEEKLRSALVGAQLYARAPETLRKSLQISLPKAAVPPPLKRSEEAFGCKVLALARNRGHGDSRRAPRHAVHAEVESLLAAAGHGRGDR